MIEKIFQGNPDEITAYVRQINAWKEGKLKRDDIIVIGKAGTVLKALNVSVLDIVITQKTLNKVTSTENTIKDNTKGHNIPLGIIKTVPEFLNDPLMIFKSRTQKNSLVIFTNAFDRIKRPVIIALHLDKSKGRIVVNEIASIYGKDNDLDKNRSLKWGTRKGLQLPPLVHPNSGYTNNLLCKEDIVNKK